MGKARPGKGQLALIPYAPDWKLSETTKEIGFQGVSRARNTLAAHKPEEGNMARQSWEYAPGSRVLLAHREFPIDATIKDSPPRVAIHDFDGSIMRDLIIGGRVVGTLFCGDVTKQNLDSSAHPTDNNFQDVGFAACFMS